MLHPAFGVMRPEELVFRNQLNPRRGWIKGEWGESENNRRARFYSLTAAGTRQLKAETAKWIDMAAVVAGILHKKADEI